MIRIFVLFLFVISCSHKGSRSPASYGLPLLEPVQAKYDGKVWMDLPVDKGVVFQGDTLTIPISFSSGSDAHGTTEYKLRSRILYRTGQSESVEQFKRKKTTKGSQDNELQLAHHWINGYTPNTKFRPDEKIESGYIRVSEGLPVNKYLRIDIDKSFPIGTYVIEISAYDNDGNEVGKKYFNVGIHSGMKYHVEVKKSGKSNLVDIRDNLGNPFAADELFFKTNNGSSKNASLVNLKRVENETGKFTFPGLGESLSDGEFLLKNETGNFEVIGELNPDLR